MTTYDAIGCVVCYLAPLAGFAFGQWCMRREQRETNRLLRYIAGLPEQANKTTRPNALTKRLRGPYRPQEPGEVIRKAEAARDALGQNYQTVVRSSDPAVDDVVIESLFVE